MPKPYGLWHSDKIPVKKRKQCEETVQRHLMIIRQKKQEQTVTEGTSRSCEVRETGTDLSFVNKDEQLLNELANMETDRPNPYYISTPDLIVQQRLTSKTATKINRVENNEMSVPLELQHQQGTMDDAAIEEFVREWRRLFIDTLQPQYLPKGWSINSSVSNDD